ncbi:MAG: PAS domain S-box protein [Holophagales bacterium]|nr:PAS domain S-box protein [Holophagales bacterium]
MAEKDDRHGVSAELRRQAEEFARTGAGPSPEGLASLEGLENLEAISPEATRQTLHELQVHQIELEMQNEELRRVQLERDLAKARYFDLYDLAPVGYCTLSERGVILEANLTAATLLGVVRAALVRQPVSRFILKDDQDHYYLLRRQLFETGSPQATELRMVKQDGTLFWAHLATTVAKGEDGAPVGRLVLHDVTQRKQAEMALRESEERHRAILETAMDGFWLADQEGRLLQVNETYCRMSGYGAPELLAMRIPDLELVEKFDDTVARIRKIVAEGEDRFESRHRRKDGSVFDVEVSVQHRPAEGGTLVAFLRDITERKQRQAVLTFLAQTSSGTTAEPFFDLLARYLAESLGMDYVCIDRLEGDGLTARTLSVWSDGHFEDNVTYSLKDTPCGDVVGQTVCCFPANVCQFFPRDQALQELRADSYVGATLWSHAGKPIGLIAVIGRKPMANRAQAERTLAVVSGRAAGELERLIAEEALRENEAVLLEAQAILRAAMDCSPAGIAIADAPSGALRYVNDAGLFIRGGDRATVVNGIGIDQYVASWKMLDLDGRPLAAEEVPLARAILFGEKCSREFVIRRAVGDDRIVWANAAPITGPGGQVTAGVVVFLDVTERRQGEAAEASLQDQLRESHKMEAIGTLAGGIAHDFNNILATILGNVELARQDLSASPLALESLEEIRKAASRARDLVQQILSFSRRQPTERRRTALAPVIESTVRLLRATLPARLALDVRCDAEAPEVLADANQIGQVLVNLVTNSMQALRNGPGRIGIRLDTVTLDAALAESHPSLGAMRARRPGQTVRLTVTDDGEGMDPATLGRVFEPFFTTRAVNEGTGLGLSVVHGIVQGHEGAIVVESVPGKGSAFTVYLPAGGALGGGAARAGAPGVEMGARAGAAIPGGEGSVEGGGGQHILYLDDDEALVFLVDRLLKRRGLRVSGFTNQRAALDALRADPARFDLVVSDYNMPGMSGLDVAREVRAIRADLPVAVASGFVDEALRTQAAEAGVRELIFKANAAEELCEALARLARGVGKRPGADAVLAGSGRGYG